MLRRLRQPGLRFSLQFFFLVNAPEQALQVVAAAMNAGVAATLAPMITSSLDRTVEANLALLVGYSDNAHPARPWLS